MQPSRNASRGGPYAVLAKEPIHGLRRTVGRQCRRGDGGAHPRCVAPLICTPTRHLDDGMQS